jgi:hypothetical protein
MADKRRRDDEDSDDFGLRTPVKRPAEKPEKPAERSKSKTGKVERPKAAAEPAPQAAPPPKKEGSGKRKALETRPAAPTSSASAPRSKTPVMVAAGLMVAAAIGGGLFLTMSGTDEPAPVIGRANQQVIIDEAPAQPRLQPTSINAPTTLQAPATIDPTAAPVAPEPVVAPTTPMTPGEKLADLRRRSANHEAVARLLEQWAELTRLDLEGADNRLFEDFRARERREQELLEELRRMGGAVVPALADMLLELDQRAQQLFVAKALAGIDSPEALKAVEDALLKTKDVALQTTLVRFLPETSEAAATLARAFGNEGNPNLRGMLLREYARRLADGDDSGREMFNRAALQDPDPNVRAEAVTLIGRRGDARDQALMEEIITKEQNLPIRQRAIVSYAETGKEQSLGFLENLARDPSASLPIRASAVLAMGRVGGDRAIQSLDLLAQSDPDQDIRLRAQRMAASLRARQQAERDGTAPQELEPGTVGPENPTPMGR